MFVSNEILAIVTFLYLFLFFLHLVYFAVRKDQILTVTRVAFYITFGLHTAGLVARWIESYRLSMGHAPLSNFYESLIFYGWCIALIVIGMKKR